jgi:signal transduction histidine kinase/DNA-binding response OmpR family regulator/ligand-binding sensor domain-containing protein
MMYDRRFHRFLCRFATNTYLFALIVFLTTGISWAQTAYTPKPSDPLTENRRWQPLDFLSAKGVRSMTDDQHGNMWFGLDKGILKYDGYDWTLYHEEAFFASPVGSLFISDTEDLFAGNESGLLQFDAGKWGKIFPSSDTVDAPVSCIKQLADGSLVAGVQHGLLRIDGSGHTIYTVNSWVNHFRNIHPEASIIILPDEVLFQRNFGRVDELFTGRDGLTWMFMSRNNDGKLIRFNLADTLHSVLHTFHINTDLDGFKLSNRTLHKLTSDGTIWLINGFYKSGIIKGFNNKWELLKLSDEFGGDELHTSILETSDGSLLIGGLGKLFVHKNNRWRVFSSPTLPIPSSRIILHESRNGWIWIAGIQGDVFRISYDDEKWTTFKGLNYQTTDAQGKQWFVDAYGKVVFNENTSWYAFDIADGLIDSPVRLTITKAGRVWVAGSHGGMAATAFLKNNVWEMQLHPALSWGIDSRAVFQSDDGSLWFGTSVDRQEALGQQSGVLQAINPDEDTITWKHHTQQDGIGQHNAYGIGQSSDGAMWLGGTNLLRYENNRWRQIPGNEYFNDFVDIVYSRKNLWVGSRYYGLFRLDGNEWQHFTINDGLPSNTIISVFEEDKNSVWVITDKDIARFDGSSWQSRIFPDDFQISREGGEIIVAEDGSVWINKALREWKRRAFPYSTTPAQAFNDYWSIRYIRESAPPKTTINVFTETVDQSGNTLIGWTGRDYWEETPAASLTYSYRLNNGEWSPFTQENSMVFTNLNNGKYTFEVRARDQNFNIEEIPAKISFVVTPPIWKQTWFIAFVIAVLLIIGIYEIRLIQRNRSLFRLNSSLKEANMTLEKSNYEIEMQKEQILSQKLELEKKTMTLEEKNTEIVYQRDQLSEMVEKVEELSRIKLRFFTNISHEFRTPLTLIIGSIEQLLKAPDPDKSRLNQAYEIIQRNTKRILRLINQILEIRKIETGKLTLNASPGDFFLFVSQVVQLFQDLASVQSLSLQFTASHTNIPASFDHDKLEKILFNLISNAFKSTPSGGTIHVSVKLLHDVLPPDQADESIQPFDWLEVVVSDNGKGIPAAHLEKIFERFYQVDEAVKHRKFDSSGIGLSYVKDLVEIHNGQIKVASQPGEGATFILQIPYISASPDQLDVANNQLTELSSFVSDGLRQEIENMGREFNHNKTDQTSLAIQSDNPSEITEKLMVLVVEDEFELRGFIRKMLEKDFDVVEAVNGAHGLEKALALQPDLIITDVMMPEMDGNELCHKLKSNLATNHIPVMMLTAQAAPENKLEGYQTGADAYLEKPFNTEFLKIRINNLLQAQQKTREKIMRDLITQPSEIMVFSEDDKILRKIQVVLEENISNSEFDVENLSQQFHLSRFHFSRKIKQITGLSPKEIIDSFRLKRAGQLLQQQKLPISEVAYMVGFEHPNSFTRAFRKYYNMTPTEFASQN